VSAMDALNRGARRRTNWTALKLAIAPVRHFNNRNSQDIRDQPRQTNGWPVLVPMTGHGYRKADIFTMKIASLSKSGAALFGSGIFDCGQR